MPRSAVIYSTSGHSATALLLFIVFCDPGVKNPKHGKKGLALSEALGLSLIPGAFSGSLCGALCGSLLLPLALGLSAEGLISYSLMFLLLGEGV